ncbi:ABC transporter ATP-binding protein [Gudongella sp. DL1XJH-153]|uniref:ABC transporter ATP-binding protein n=1 Tax=Gudongella sp. DL1XJH-153 TaxID=3409804 RepID=UPI003BB4B068
MDIRIDSITHHYGTNRVLDDVSLLAEHGQLVALLGPSGCGKTTLLRLISGLLQVEKGAIHFGDLNVTEMDPRKRNAVMVFQSYALFPHLTVGENIAYGLKVRGFSKEDRKKRIMDILQTVELEGYEDRRISQLSGGQQQRVALARALIVQPDALLFDEPLSNLDEKLRVSMRQEIRRIQKKADITGIYVTHDQEEAMSIADMIVIMNSGVIQQIGPPREVYENPVNKFVAEFMGECNFIEYADDTYMVRPDGIIPSKDGEYSGIVEWVEYLGSITRLSLQWHRRNLIMDVPSIIFGESIPMEGQELGFDIKLQNAVIMND